MKKLFVVALLLVGTSTFAQERMGENNDKLTPEQRVNLQVKKLTKELNLSVILGFFISPLLFLKLSGLNLI